MDEYDLQARTKSFALRVLKLIDCLPRTAGGRIVADQLGRAGTSVAANYRAVCRGRSKAEFIAKLGTVEEEADESAFWIEFARDAGLVPAKKVDDLLDEATQLTRIMAASRLTARNNSVNRKSQIANRK